MDKPVGMPGNAEAMAEFFDQRVSDYEQHMAEHIEDFGDFYASVARAIPEVQRAPHILDLGVGTGLELDGIFERFPSARVTGIDLSRAMLEHLADKPRPWIPQVRLICRSFLDADFGEGVYDVVVSVMALHHWIPEVKIDLYRRIRRALVPGGRFVNADYVETKEESARRLEAYDPGPQGDRHLLHIDLPLTPEAESKLLHEAGFASVRIPFQRSRCTTIVATVSDVEPVE